MAKNNWFSVDKEGLAQVYARRGPAAPFFELISNAWDEEGVTQVTLTVTALPGTPKVEVRCIDNSTNGFRNLDDACTLFAPSYKKGEAEQRGRFNVGEKLFLALCEAAKIQSTGGTLSFRSDGALMRSRARIERGTEIWARMRMTREDAELAFDGLDKLYVPAGITTKIEFIGFGKELVHEFKRDIPCALAFDARLQTELSDGEGVIRPTQRIGRVEVWDAELPNGGWLFELGIPVVEIGGPFDIDVMQKVPLNVDRDNVTPAFLRRLRAEVLNHAYRRITDDAGARAPWITEAMGSTNPAPRAEALAHVMDLRYGKKRVAYDPSDKEGSQIAVSKGYTVVHGGSLPREVWDNVREHDTIRPAGQVTPSSRAVFSQNGEDVSIPRNEYPEGGRELCDTFASLGSKLIGKTVNVRIVKRLQSSSGGTVLACYGGRTILLSLRGLTKRWFKDALDATTLMPKHVELLLHELGHEYSGSHLDEKFHESQTELGVALAFMVIAEGKRVIEVR